MWGEDITYPYNFITNYTEKTYEYLIEEVFDNDTELIGYKNHKGNPSKVGKKNIASEVYSFFGAHYYKVVETILSIEKNNRQILYNNINIVDIGANIGTATFAYLDLLSKKLNSNNINVNIVFVEPDKDRISFLRKTIEKYKQLSGFNIKFHIENSVFETCKENIMNKLQNSSTVVLVSNVLNWPKDVDIFKEKLIEITDDNNFATYIVNIESKCQNAQQRFIDMYNSLKSLKLLDIEKTNTLMPSYKNPRLNYFRLKYNNDVYTNTKKTYFNYGYMIKHPIVIESVSIENLKRSYYKSIYTIRNYFLHDSIELKYIGENLDQIAIYISEIIQNDIDIKPYECQYLITKPSGEYRSMYIDDIISDIIYAAIIITKGVELDNLQNDEVSFGNRVNKDINSPFVFLPYYNQFFEKFKGKIKEYSKVYSNYYKIDLKSYYNNIEHNLLKEKIESNVFECRWYIESIYSYISKPLMLSEEGKGICQGSDFSHLIANLYLQEFDDWFIEKFDDAKMIRYVDDITIFSNSEERCLQIKQECCNYLDEKLFLSVNESKNEYGLTANIEEDKNKEYFEEISKKASEILRCLYKLDSKNYNYYKKNTDTFLKVYQKCLSKIGISISLEWLSIKLEKEENFLKRLELKIRDFIKMEKWLRKKVYKFNIDLGEIPTELDNKKIDIWEEKFKSNKKNKALLDNIKSVINDAELKMEYIINKVKLNEEDKKLYNSLFKFTMKKMSTFKSKKVILWIEDILRYFPQCDKKMLWSYPELGDSILNMLLENLNKADLDKYDLYAHIWLLGEYKHTKSRDKIEEIFINSYETTNKFLNTTATEAILKIGTCSDNFIENITEYLNYTKDYYFIRNILLILNNSELNKFDEIINNLDIETYDKRVKLFIEWICNNKNKNLIEEVNLLPDEIIDKYRDYYPMEETYSGYKSL